MDYYELLEVSPRASYEVIRNAYRALALKYHPDTNSIDDKETAEEKMKQINLAYQILYTPKTRAEYDEKEKHKNSNNGNHYKYNNNGHDQEAEEQSKMFNYLNKLVLSVITEGMMHGLNSYLDKFVNKHDSDYYEYLHKSLIHCDLAMCRLGYDEQGSSLYKNIKEIENIVKKVDNDSILLKKVKDFIISIFRNTVKNYYKYDEKIKIFDYLEVLVASATTKSITILNKNSFNKLMALPDSEVYPYLDAELMKSAEEMRLKGKSKEAVALLNDLNQIHNIVDNVKSDKLLVEKVKEFISFVFKKANKSINVKNGI
ncbi:MAG TPA: DnaJ domain-containing protein [Clostridium sp.]|uniref:J domain-containing protein n=1 Tax=Clostridium sp. TaxID=1506 RepID=UPI002F93A7B9